MLPTPEHFKEFLKLHGIKKSTKVVIYGQVAGAPYWPARAFWMFKAFSHEEVSLLDGGLSKWVAEGRPVEQDTDVGTDADYDVNINHDILREFDYVYDLNNKIAAGESDLSITDARWKDKYDLGHIPSSKSVPFTTFLNDDGTVKSREDVLKLLQDNGVDPSKPIVSSCGWGVTASYNFAAFKYAGL